MNRHFTFQFFCKKGLAALIFLLALGVPSASCSTQKVQWTLSLRQRVGILATRYTAVAYYVPRRPERILVLAHGFPWADGTMSDEKLTAYARADAERWAGFAEANDVILLVPAFGGRNFPHYGQMVGRIIRPDELIDQLVDGPAARLLPHFNGRFSLHGHSAGGQFASRYLVMHPDRLDQVILSAPSTYPMPDPTLAWPYGMAPATAEVLKNLTGGGAASEEQGSSFVPNSDVWLRAATHDSVTALVGTQDLETRPPALGQLGSTRIERADAWVKAMQQFAQSRGKVSTIHLVMANGLSHDEAAIAIPAQKLFALKWASHAD